MGLGELLLVLPPQQVLQRRLLVDPPLHAEDVVVQEGLPRPGLDVGVGLLLGVPSLYIKLFGGIDILLLDLPLDPGDLDELLQELDVDLLPVLQRHLLQHLLELARLCLFMRLAISTLWGIYVDLGEAVGVNVDHGLVLLPVELVDQQNGPRQEVPPVVRPHLQRR